MCPFSLSSPFLSPRHRRAIQKSRGSKVRRAEGTMESETGAPASTASSTGTTTSSTSTSSSSTTAASSTSTSNTTATTSITSTSSSNSSSSSSSSSNTSNSSSSSTTAGRQAVSQLSAVYSGMPDRQTVQVSFWLFVDHLIISCDILCSMQTHSDHMHFQMHIK